jgi:hypothetical protein
MMVACPIISKQIRIVKETISSDREGARGEGFGEM